MDDPKRCDRGLLGQCLLPRRSGHPATVRHVPVARRRIARARASRLRHLQRRHSRRIRRQRHRLGRTAPDHRRMRRLSLRRQPAVLPRRSGDPPAGRCVPVARRRIARARASRLQHLQRRHSGRVRRQRHRLGRTAPDHRRLHVRASSARTTPPTGPRQPPSSTAITPAPPPIQRRANRAERHLRPARRPRPPEP